MKVYGLPYGLFSAIARDLFAGRSRSLLADSRSLLASLPQPPETSGEAELPPVGGCTLIYNHYQRPGLWIGFFGALLVDAVSRARRDADNLRFVVTDRVPVQLGTRTIDVPASRFFLTRAAALWKMLPLSARPNDVMPRGATLRRALGCVRQGGIIAIAPEGAVRGDKGLQPAMQGTGLLLHWLSRYGPIVPVGVWEEVGRLHAHFGNAFCVDSSSDDVARLAAMRRIAQLLPRRLHGAYAQTCECADE